MTRSNTIEGMQVVHGCLIVTVAAALDDEALTRLRRAVLERVRDTGVRAAVLDVTAVEIMDSVIAEALAAICGMAALLGARTVLLGMRAGAAAALADLGARLPGVLTAASMDGALRMLQTAVASGKRGRPGTHSGRRGMR